MKPLSYVSGPRRLVLLHEHSGELPDSITEQDDGIFIFRSRPPTLAIEVLRDGEHGGQPRPVATLTLAHAKIQPQWLVGQELVYLGERPHSQGRALAGQALYRITTADPSKFSRIAEYPLGSFHWVARRGSQRFFERIGTGHDAYFEDGFLSWDPTREGAIEELKALPADAVPVFPPCLHSFSHRQGDPTLTLGLHRFSLKRLRAGNDATWTIEAARGNETPRPLTSENETVSCARLAGDRLFYLRGPSTGSTLSLSGDNTLVCHFADNPESSIEVACGPASAFRVSAGRASLFHVHGNLIAVLTDKLRIFRLE